LSCGVPATSGGRICALATSARLPPLRAAGLVEPADLPPDLKLPTMAIPPRKFSNPMMNIRAREMSLQFSNPSMICDLASKLP